MTFAERLRATRREQHLTQYQLAEKAGITHAAICQYEQDRNGPSAFAVCCLADVLGTTMDYLYGRSDKRE